MLFSFIFLFRFSSLFFSYLWDNYRTLLITVLFIRTDRLSCINIRVIIIIIIKWVFYIIFITNGAINYHAHQKFFLASLNIQFLKHTAFTCELQEQGTFLFCFSICHLQLFESVLWIFGWWNGNLIRNTRKTNQVSLNSTINFNTIIYFRLCMEQENILMAKLCQ